MCSDQFATSAAAIAALSFDEENERLAELDRQIAEAHAAQDRARLRIAEINGDRRTSDKLAAANIADALLAGDDGAAVDTLVRSEESLAAEKEGLIAALSDLTGRIQHFQAEQSQVKQEVRSKIAAAAKDMADAVLRQAQEQAEALADSVAALRAIERATGLHTRAADSARDAVRALMEDQGLVTPRRTSFDVPAQVIEVLQPLQNAGAAYPSGKHGIGRTVSW